MGSHMTPPCLGSTDGRPKEKPFRDALMIEIAAAGDDHKALRKIAAALLAKAAGGDVPEINARRVDPTAQPRPNTADDQSRSVMLSRVSTGEQLHA